MDNWSDVISTNWRILTAIIFGLLMALVLPLVGIGWCCKKCCCSRGKIKPTRKKGDRASICCQVRKSDIVNVREREKEEIASKIGEIGERRMKRD